MSVGISRTAINLVATTAVLILAFLTSVTLARALGPTLRGEIAAAVLWPILLPYLGGIGLIDALVYHAASPYSDSRRILGACLLLGTAASVVLMSAGVVMMPWLLQNQPSHVVHGSRILLLGIPLVLYTEFVSSLLRAKLMLFSYNAQRLVVPTGYFIGVVALHLIDALTLGSIVALQLLLILTRLLVAIILCRLRHVTLGLRTDWPMVKDVLLFSGKSHLGASSEFVTSRIDQTMIAAWRSPTELGFYVAALGTTSLVSSLSQAIRITILPQLAGEGDARHQDAILIRAFQAYWLVMVIGAPLFAVSLRWVIPMVYGESFRGAVTPAIILVMAAVAFGGKDILATGSKAMGKPMLSSGVEAITIIAMLSLLLVLLPEYGIVGAASSMVGAHALGMTLLALGLYRSRGLSPIELFAVQPRDWNLREMLTNKGSARR